jgi:uncharacterized protein
MVIFIRVKFENRKEKIERIDKENYIVYTKELPVKGRANKAVIKILAKYFKKDCSKIKIISGKNSRKKVIEII